MGLRTSDQTYLGTCTTRKDWVRGGGGGSQGARAACWDIQHLQIPFSENTGTIYAQIQGSAVIVLKPWKASYSDFSGVF